MKKILIILFVHLSLFLNAQSITADAADRDVKSGAFANWVGQKDIRVGSSGIALIIPFELPELASGSGVTAASFAAYLSSVANSPTGNVVLSGLSYRSANTVLVADFDAASTVITSTYATPTSSAGTLTEDNQNLIDYINAQYDSGAVAGDFIFFKLHSTEVQVGSNYWVFNSVDNGSNKPTLTLTTGTLTNVAPVLATIGNQTVRETTTVVVNISASDANSDNLTFSTTDLPSFATLNDNGDGTATISISPVDGDATTYTFTVKVADSEFTDSEEITLTVTDKDTQDPNKLPELAAISSQSVEEGSVLTLNLSATDGDNDALTFSVNNLPSFAVFTDNGNGTAKIVYTPLEANNHAGSYPMTVSVSDTKDTDSETFTLTVSEYQEVAGTAYYCDPVNGSMNNDGLTQATAWGSLEAVFGNTTARNKITAGDVLFLMDGAHGQPYMGKSNTDYVTVKPAPGASPKISSVLMNGSKYWHFDNITFTSDGTGGGFNRDYLFSTDKNTTFVKITNCTFYDEENSSSWSKSDWESSVDALIIRGGNFIFDNNLITNVYFALEYQGDVSTVITNNTIDNFGADAIRALGSNTLIENNLIRDAYVENYAIQHDDAIQMYDKTNVTAGTVANVIIRNNTILQFADPITQAMVDADMVGYSMQGIIQTDGHSDNIVVENNLVVSDHYHGITLPGAVNCRVQNNTVMKTPTSVNPTADAQPWIRFAKSKQGNFSHDCIMRNNISTFKTESVHWEFDENATSGTNRNNLRENNITQAEADYSILFTDYNKFDLSLIDGSIAIDKGVNTDLTATDIEGNTRMVGLLVDCGAFEVQADSDDNAPKLTKATDTYFDNEVVIMFSESVTKATAELASNYTLNNGTNVVSAVLDADAVTVTLTTTTMSGNVLYTVTANSVEDFAGNKANNTSTTFTYLCGSISASSYQDDQWGKNPPDGAFDGNMATKWAANGDGEWILKNYCSTQLFKNVSIAFGLGDERIYYFSIEISNDGINYTEVFDGQSSKNLTKQNFDIDDTSGKYLRIIGGGNDAVKDGDRNLWNNYVEVSIEKEGVDAPEFTTGNIADQNLTEGDAAVVLNVSATASTDLTYSITPNDLPFVELNDLDNGSATITISPQTGDVGEYKKIQLTVTDENGISSSQYFDITIIAVGAPEFTTGSIADQNLTEGDAAIVINVSATSSTSLSYSFSHSNLSFIEFEDLGSGSATITINPQTGDAGDYSNIQVTVTDANGLSASRSFDIKIVESNNLGDNELFVNSISVYPNPVTNNTFTIDFSDDLEGKTNVISVYSLNGVVIYNREVINYNELEIVLPEATASGLYLLNLSNNEFTIQKKIIIK